MSIIGTRCPPGYMFDNEKLHSFSDCLHKCKQPCMPKPLLNVLLERLRTDHHKGNYISATALQNCMRKTYLERTVDYFVRPSDRMFDSMRGSLVHETLGRQPKDQFIIEKDFYCDFNGVRLFGRLDLYDKKNKILYDFKTTKDLGFDMILREGLPKKDHIWQANIYRYLLKHGRARSTYFLKEDNKYNSYLDITNQTELFKPEEYLINLDVEKIHIIYVCMKGVAETGTKVFRKVNKQLVSQKIKNIPILSDKKVKEYIEDRIFILDKAFKTGELPPIPDKDTQGWMCGTNYKNMDGWCSVRYQCPFWIEEAKKRGIETQEHEIKDKNL